MSILISFIVHFIFFLQKDSPTVLSVILNQQGEKVVYCEDPASRNESGSAMLVHFESTTTTKYENKGRYRLKNLALEYFTVLHATIIDK